jgi:hypothetical protein
MLEKLRSLRGIKNYNEELNKLMYIILFSRHLFKTLHNNFVFLVPSLLFFYVSLLIQELIIIGTFMH